MVISEFVSILEGLKKQHGDIRIFNEYLSKPPVAFYLNERGIGPVIMVSSRRKETSFEKTEIPESE